ncbi:sigma-70 family RNA polymerase sigma factor [Sphingobacterium alkalisoli]|uniref:Sigma-70 family RNA polymerase sigma factor n=2 Tax=Sphingobacterium alkalisoli TaxID=1874115 RepID=A0A4U0H1Z2_9SPHI|nr:sigma-70 family RNA polymerase sigma factor [Sphingobacterium alkalisoli]
MKILPKYLKKNKPLSLKMALEECVVSDTERSKSFIYKKFYGYLMAVALRYIQDEMEAEDVVNESFVKVFRKLNAFSFHDDEEVLEKTFKAWIARITVNTSIDKLRAKKEIESIDDVSDKDLVHHAVTASTKLEEQDILRLLYELPEIQRSIFNLYEIEGYSHEEIGRLLNVPESTSRTYLTRAKSKLRKLYMDQVSELQNIHHS